MAASVPPLKVLGKMKRVLFLCSGNYYRSRFAEIYFNWHAQLRGIGWRAESRGLRPDARNAGPLSRHTAAALAEQGISWAEYLRAPLRATDADFAAADRVIAVKEAEHRPMMEARGATADRIGRRQRLHPRVDHAADCDGARRYPGRLRRSGRSPRGPAAQVTALAITRRTPGCRYVGCVSCPGRK